MLLKSYDGSGGREWDCDCESQQRELRPPTRIHALDWLRVDNSIAHALLDPFVPLDHPYSMQSPYHTEALWLGTCAGTELAMLSVQLTARFKSLCL